MDPAHITGLSPFEWVEIRQLQRCLVEHCDLLKNSITHSASQGY